MRCIVVAVEVVEGDADEISFEFFYPHDPGVDAQWQVVFAGAFADCSLHFGLVDGELNGAGKEIGDHGNGVIGCLEVECR